MRYAVKEIFYTLQGEGAQTGRPAVFCRFSGCNLWNGREEDRARAVCRFCDTDFVGVNGPGGGHFANPADLAKTASKAWPSSTSPRERRYIVCTGGEPLLQLDQDLVDAFHVAGFEVAIETNGTRPSPKGVDWICVSPKAGSDLVLKAGDELKLIFPQPGAEPPLFEHLAFSRFYLQPMDGLLRQRNTELVLRYCLEHPQWRLSLQAHKMLGIT
jgi:7-carboxy-7-deazaguanine synthase (Cx14CxxC type)